MVNFYSQQIRNNIAPAFQPEEGVDYTGRMNSPKATSVAGYDIEPFEYADAKLPVEVGEIKTNGIRTSVFREFFMGVYRATQKYDFLIGSIEKNSDFDTSEILNKYQVGQILKVFSSENKRYYAMQRTESPSAGTLGAWKNLGELSEEDSNLIPLSATDIPIPEEQLCLCIKGPDRPLISNSGFYSDDTDYFFMYREAGQTYTQRKTHSPWASRYNEKPASQLEVSNA